MILQDQQPETRPAPWTADQYRAWCEESLTDIRRRGLDWPDDKAYSPCDDPRRLHGRAARADDGPEVIAAEDDPTFFAWAESFLQAADFDMRLRRLARHTAERKLGL